MEARELPAGWVTAALGDLIARVDAGKNFRCIERPPTGGEVGVVKVSAVSWGSFRQDESKTVPDGIQLGPASLIKEGDLLFSRANTIELVGACVQVGKIDKVLHLSDKILRLDTVDEGLKPWIHRFLSSPRARKHLSDASSGNQLSMRNISQRVLLDASIPLAPLNEQRRIAAELDTILAAVDACRQRLDGVAAILRRFRQAVLAAATTGELTREWREEGGIAADWPEVQLGDHAEGFNYGTSAKSHREGEIPVLRMGNIQAGEIDWGDLVYTSDLEEIAKYMLEPGDVLFNRTNSPELVGKTALYRGEQPAIYAGYLIRLRCSASLDPEFLNLSLNSPHGKDYCWSVKSDGVSQSNINAKKLAAYPLKLPPIEEQQEIVSRAQELFTLADQLDARLTAARRIVDRLTPSLLAKAFRGELVPQDPNDEPANVLLERIRAARQAQAGAGKPSRRGRRKAAANPDQIPLDAAPVPPDLLSGLLQECGALSERALLAASELDPSGFRAQLALEEGMGAIRQTVQDGQVLLEAVG